jgi:hypothetical protein
MLGSYNHPIRFMKRLSTSHIPTNRIRYQSKVAAADPVDHQSIQSDDFSISSIDASSLIKTSSMKTMESTQPEPFDSLPLTLLMFCSSRNPSQLLGLLRFWHLLSLMIPSSMISLARMTTESLIHASFITLFMMTALWITPTPLPLMKPLLHTSRTVHRLPLPIMQLTYIIITFLHLSDLVRSA